MDTLAKKLKLFISVLSRVPLAARVALWHTLHLSQQSKYLDLRTELTVALIRSFVDDSNPRSISSTQKLLGRDPGVKGRIWISTYVSPVPPEPSVRDALLAAVEGLAAAGMSAEPKPVLHHVPDLVPVEAEWTGYRADATAESRLPPQLSEKGRYEEMMKECRSPATILYFHGGAYWLMDPATHRPTTKKLAKITGGRCFSVRYRLAPQNPFPAAILDALVSYLTLLYPPPDAFHEAVSPAHIVFAGDSAGGNLSLALMQTILELRRQNYKITWHGEERELPLPAGCAVSSPWMDMTLSSPSWTANKRWDYLPSGDRLEGDGRPPCAAWPASPPRKSVYVEDGLLLHPLATLLAARDWRGCPPVYLCTGWELLADEDKAAAARLDACGVPVVLEEYEAMPHCFALMFGHLPAARRCFDAWAGFVGRVTGGEGVESRFTTVRARTLEEVPISKEALRRFSDEETMERLRKRCEEMVPVGLAGVQASAKL